MDSPPPTEVDPERAAEDKGPGIITAIVIVTVLETLFVAARLYVRGVIKKKLQPDDYIIVVAVVRFGLGLSFHRLCDPTITDWLTLIASALRLGSCCLWSRGSSCRERKTLRPLDKAANVGFNPMDDRRLRPWHLVLWPPKTRRHLSPGPAPESWPPPQDIPMGSRHLVQSLSNQLHRPPVCAVFAC